MDRLIKDICNAIRILAKRPGLLRLDIGLGIGASTAIFSAVDGVLLRPLPCPNAEQIVRLREVNERAGKMPFAEPNFLDVQKRVADLWTEFAAHRG